MLTLALALVAIVATGWVFAPPAKRLAPVPPPGHFLAKGQALFAAPLKPLGAAHFQLQTLRGKPVVAYFWPSWCTACAAEAQALQGLQMQHRDNGLVVLGLGIDQADALQRFKRTHGLEFPVFAGGQAAIDLSKKMGNLREGMPFVVAVDRQGQAVASHLGTFGPLTAQEMVMAALK